ncbi:ABC-three component system middle component 1 [Brevundimonas sp. SL161]|uniref:ABC-three component system middle component 1 n=1 Tax=Brevundimonas sp. SL161 TaxID=2804613 RepID=UPI003CF746F5
MIADLLAEKLLGSAKALDWPTSVEDSFASRAFRGRPDAAEVSLPDGVIGLRLGPYPVLVAPVVLASSEQMQASLRTLHNQMVIARSYMRAEEVINAHIMLCVIETEPSADWRGVIDYAERDESVSRKVVWMPDAKEVETSYRNFIARTFLAQPWRSHAAVLDAPLDHNEGLAERILVRHGLSEAAAARWVELAEAYSNDPDGLIPQLVEARRNPE